FLLSANVHTDLSDTFQQWRWPLTKPTRDAILAVSQAGWSDAAIRAQVTTLLGKGYVGGTMAAQPTGVAVTDMKNGRGLTISWTKPADTKFAQFNVYRAS